MVTDCLLCGIYCFRHLRLGYLTEKKQQQKPQIPALNRAFVLQKGDRKYKISKFMRYYGRKKVVKDDQLESLPQS